MRTEEITEGRKIVVFCEFAFSETFFGRTGSPTYVAVLWLTQRWRAIMKRSSAKPINPIVITATMI